METEMELTFNGCCLHRRWH